jgi:hypothetical protein
LICHPLIITAIGAQRQALLTERLRFGGTSQLGAWILSFGTCGLACLAGAAATIFLSRDVWQR